MKKDIYKVETDPVAKLKSSLNEMTNAIDNLQKKIQETNEENEKTKITPVDLTPVIEKLDEIGDKLKPAPVVDLTPVVEKLDRLIAKKDLEFPDLQLVKVDNQSPAVEIPTGEGDIPGSANPSKYVPVRLTNGKRFYEAQADAYVAAARTVFPYVNATSGKPQPAAVDDNGAVRTDITVDTVNLTVSGTQQVVGDIASQQADSSNPVKVGGSRRATLPTYADGVRSSLHVDEQGLLLIRSGQPLTISGTTTISGLTTGVYGAPPTVTSGQQWPLQIDVNGNLKNTLATKIAGEDLSSDVMKVEQQFTPQNITTNATTTVKSGAGFLDGIVINKAGAANTATIYDNTAGSGTVIATIDTTVSGMPQRVYHGKFNVGLTIVTAGGNPPDLTIIYR